MSNTLALWEWKEKILEELEKEKETTITNLSKKWKVSTVTIKPALEVLKAEEKIKTEYRGRSTVYMLR